MFFSSAACVFPRVGQITPAGVSTQPWEYSTNARATFCKKVRCAEWVLISVGDTDAAVDPTDDAVTVWPVADVELIEGGMTKLRTEFQRIDRFEGHVINLIARPRSRL